MKPQCHEVLKYLKRHGSITPLAAQTMLGISRLASRVYDLRAAGYEIRSERRRVKTRSGWANVSRYSL